ncbi:MAG: hypothetical protein ABI654_07130 [Betaproteobacteria bacterium]
MVDVDCREFVTEAMRMPVHDVQQYDGINASGQPDSDALTA